MISQNGFKTVLANSLLQTSNEKLVSEITKPKFSLPFLITNVFNMFLKRKTFIEPNTKIFVTQATSIVLKQNKKIHNVLRQWWKIELSDTFYLYSTTFI